MNDQSFFQNVSTYKQKIKLLSIFQLVFLVIAIVGDFILLSLMARHFHKNNPVLVLPIVLLFTLLVINAIFTSWMSQKIARDTGMVCPSCNKTVGGRAIPIIIATHNCIHCGKEFYRT